MYLAAYPNVQLSGSNFSLVITPYLWGSVSADLSSVNLSSTLFDVKLTPTDSNNTNTKLVAVFIGANLANAGYITTDTNNPVPVPSTPDLGNQLSFSDPLSGVDSGYTLWALGPNSAQSPNSPQEVVLVVDNTPSTASNISQVLPRDQPFTPSLPVSSVLSAPSAASTYAVIVYNGSGYELVGSLPVEGEPGPCGAANVNPSVTCHDFSSLANITLTNGQFSELTRADNAPSPLPSYTAETIDVNGNDTATCGSQLLAIPSLNLAVGYSYTPSTDQMVEINTNGSHYQTVIDVTDGTNVTCSDSNQDASLFQAELPNSEIPELTLKSGTTYSIYIGDYPPLQSEDVCDTVDSNDNPLPCPLTSDPVLSFSLSIVPETTATELSCSPQSAVVSSPVNCTATVTDTAITTNTPMGTVQFAFATGSSSTPAETLTGSLSNGVASATTSDLNAGSYKVTATLQPSTVQFQTSNGSTTLTVNQATPTITWATPAAITFGTALSATQLDASSTVAGTFAYSPAAGTVLKAGSHTLSVTFTPSDTTDYTAATSTVTLTVNQATPTITWATPVAITYGTALSATQLDASSTAAGNFSYTPALGTVLGAGPQTLSVKFTPADSTDYSKVTKTVTLAVNQASQTITFPTIPAQTVGTLLTLSASASSGLPVRFTSTTTGICTVSGTTATFNAAGPCTIDANQAGNSNYEPAQQVQQSIKVNALPGFTLSATPMTVSVAQGGSGTITITPADVAGFSGTVSLAASGLPSGVTASFAPGSVAGTQVLTLTAATSSTVTSAPVTVTITGTSGTLSANTSIALTITAEPSFTAGSGGTNSITLTPGATTGNAATISVVGTNGFSGTVSLTCAITSSPTGANDPPTCSLSPTSVPLSGTTTQTSTLTVNTTASSSAENRMQKLFRPTTGGTALALILLFCVPRRQRNWMAMLGLLVLFVSIGAVGCSGGGGSGGGGGGGGGGGNSGTTTGSYTITVTGTSGSQTATVGTIALTVN